MEFMLLQSQRRNVQKKIKEDERVFLGEPYLRHKRKKHQLKRPKKRNMKGIVIKIMITSGFQNEEVIDGFSQSCKIRKRI